MPNNQANLNIGVKYNVDQSSVNAVRKSLQDLQNIKTKDFNGPKKDLELIQQIAGKVLIALNNAFNVNLNSLNTKAFNSELQKAGLSVDKIYSSFSKAGAQGQVAFSRMATEVLTTNLQLKLTNSLVSKMGETMANTVKWGIASSIMNSFTNSVQQAFQYVQSLDSALTDIRIVTGDSREEMAKFAQEANNAAQSLGRSTMDYTKAALTFYQQGLSEEDVQARTEAVLKAQNITGAGDEMANYLTAVWNGYKVANEEAELYVDKLASVADSSASNMSLLAIAMSKVASTANAMGVDVDQLNAQIATIVATTRQAPESVGNALKTIYSRINDISTGAEDALISLGNYSSKMLDVGISVLDANGNLRDTGEVIELIGGKWSNLSREQQIYLARTMAGQRQYNNLIALFDNWSKYSDLVNISMLSQGTLVEKNARYMDSLGAKMLQLGAAGERVKDALINEDDLKGLVGFGAEAVNLFGSLILSIGGGRGALLSFGSVFTQLFSGTIAKELNNTITNIQNVKANLLRFLQDKKNIELFAQSAGYREDVITLIIKEKDAAKDYYKYMETALINLHNQLIKNIAAAKEDLLLINDRKDAAEKFAKSFVMSQTSKGQGISGFSINDKILSEDFQELSGTALLTVEALQDQIDEFSFEEPLEGLQSLKTSYEQLKNEVGEKPLEQLAGFDGYQKALDAIKDKANPTETEVRRVKIALLNLLDQANKRISDAGSLKQLGDQAKIAEQNLTFAQKAAKEYLQNIQQFSTIKTFVNMAAGAGQVASGINNLINLTKIWNNENISAGEKIIQTFTNLSMTIPMLVNGFNQVNKGLTLFIGKIGAMTVAHGANTGATIADIAAQQGLAVALKEVAIAGWGAVAPFAPLIIALGAAAGAAYLFYKAWNQENEVALKAAETAKKAKLSYDELKTSYDNLKSSLLNYNSAQEAISEMTRGTQEWRDAIRESNDAVLDLIKNYPELADKVLNVNGRLVLSELVQKEILLRQSNAVDAARLANILADSNSRKATFLANAREQTRFSDVTNRGLAIRFNSDRINSGYDAGSIFGPKIELVLAVLQAAIDNTTATGLELIEELSESTGVSKDNVRFIINNTEHLDQLKSELKSNTLAAKLAYTSLASLRLQDLSTYQDFDEIEQQLADAIGGRILQERQKEEEAKLENASAQDLIAAFTAATGQNITSYNDGVFQVGDKSYTEDQFKALIASTEALKGFETAVLETTQSMIKAADETGNGEALRGFMAGGDFSNLTEEELNSLNPKSHEMATFFNLNYIDAGFESGKAFQDAFIQAQEDSLSRFDNLSNSYAESVKNAIDNLPDVALGTKEKLANALKAGFESGGEEGLHQLTRLIDGTKPEDLEGLSSILLGIDWTQDGAVYELKNAIELQGIEVGLTGVRWLTFILTLDKTMNKAYNAADAIDTLRGVAFKLKDLNTGDVLDEQAYQDLIKLKPELKDFFKISDEGYMFIGKQLQVAEALKNTTQLTIKELKLMQSVALLVASSDIGTKASLIDVDNLLNYRGRNGQTEATADNTNFNKLTQDEAFHNALLLSGVSLLAFDKAKTFIENNTHESIFTQGLEQLYLEAKGVIQQALDSMATMQSDAENGVYESELRKAQELSATRAQSLEELRNLYYNELILLEDYSDMREVLVLKLVENLGITREEYDNTFNLLKDHLEETSDSFQGLSKAEKDVELDQLTERVYELGDALDDLKGISSDTFDNIQYAINNKLNVDAVEGFTELKTTLSEIFQTDIDTSFIQENFDLIRQLALGNVTALSLLQAKLGQDYIAKISAEADIPATDSALLEIQGLINSTKLDDLPLGISLDDAGFTDAITKFAYMAGMSADQINELLGNISFEPEVTEQEIPMEQIQHSEQTGKYTYQYEDPVTHLVSDIDVTQYMHNALAGATKIKIPIINGKKIKYTGGSRGASFASPPTPPKSPGGGGGGRGSSPKTATPSKAKINTSLVKRNEQEAEYDPYEQIDKQIKRQTDLLDDLEEKEKHLSGAERYKNLQLQNKELEEQADLLELRIRINKKDAGEKGTSAWYAERLKDTFGNNIFDKDGLTLKDENKLRERLVNMYNKRSAAAEKAFKDAQKDYNNWINNVWNKQSKEWQDAHKDLKEKKDAQIKAAELSSKNNLKSVEDWYKQNLDYIEDYKKALEEAAQDEEELQKIREAIVDNKIANFEMKIDLAVDTGDLERDWLDFEKKFVKKIRDDDIFGQALYDSKLFQSYFDSSLVQTRAKQIAELQALISKMEEGIAGGTYGGEGVENRLRLAQERLKELLADQMKDYLKLQELAEDMMDHYLDSLDDAKDKMDDQVDQYERVNDLIEHNVRLALLIYGDKAYDTMDKYYDMQKSNNETILQNLRAEQLYWQNMLNNETVGSDAWKSIKKHLDDTTDDLNSKLEDMIENLSDQWENRIDGIIAKLNNALTGGRGLDYLDEQWDYINDFDDKFLDTVESHMGINEVTNLYQDAIDDLAGNPASQQKINKLMNDQLKILREKDKLTQYDIDRAKAALEVLKARMALEDARYNKTKMRLRRDSQGNYTYQYVADEEKLSDLQSALADAQANLYNMDKEHYKQNLNDMYDTYKDYINKMKDLTEELRQAQAAGDDEEAARVQSRIDLLKLSINATMSGLLEDNEVTLMSYLRQSFFDSLDIDPSQYSEVEQLNIMQENIPQMQSNIQDLANTIREQGGIISATADSMKAINEATKEYDDTVEHLLEKAGTSVETVMKVTDEYGNALDKNIQQAQTMTGYYTDLINKSVDAVDKVRLLLDLVLNGINNISQDNIDNLITAYNAVQEGLNGVNKVIDDETGEKLVDAAAALITNNPDLVTAKLDTTTGNMSPEEYQEYLNKQIGTGSLNQVAESLEKISNLDINNLAEEDLNSVVDTMKNIVNYFGNATTQGLDSLMKEASSYIGTISNVEHLDQNVHIEAHFPNVVNHLEIEAAINNLVNIASQKASTYSG